MKSRAWPRGVIPFFGVILLLFFREAAMDGVRSGCLICANTLIPTLFPISVLTGCLIRMHTEGKAGGKAGIWFRKALGLPGFCAVPLVLGLLGGFPLGAQLTADLYESGRLSREDAIRLSALSNNAGPAFLLGSVGAVLRDPTIGLWLLGIQTLSTFFVGLLLKKPKNHGAALLDQRPPASAGFFSVLPASLESSAAAMLRLAAAVCFFRAWSSCLERLIPFYKLPALYRAGCLGLLEIVGGVTALQEVPGDIAFPMAALLIGWGGLCVHLQTAAALRRVGLPIKEYLSVKLLQALFAFSFAAFITRFR